MIPSAFSRACVALESALASPLRTRALDAACRQPTMARALKVLGDAMRSHGWRAADIDIDLGPVIDELDRAARAEGFHVLHDWNGKAGAVTPNTIAVDVLEFAVEHLGDGEPRRATLAIVLDYYFMYLLALVAMRAWESGEPGSNLDRVTGLVAHLQGQYGSGQRFADNAETLLLVATSHYEPVETGYDLLLTRARALPDTNRTAMALTHAQAMGGHLRFGYEVTYGKDFKAMRDDNGADYPWLLFGLAGLMDEYVRLEEIDAPGAACLPVVEGLINGLTPDPLAVLGKPVSWFAPHEAELDRFLSLFDKHRGDLMAQMEAHRPRDHGYWPIALFFNFSQNILKGAVVDAMLRGQPTPFGLNDLFSGFPQDTAAHGERAALARRLMAYARAHPDTIRGRLAPVIVYDPIIGRQSFGGAMRAIKQR